MMPSVVKLKLLRPFYWLYQVAGKGRTFDEFMIQVMPVFVWFIPFCFVWSKVKHR
jgi:hypothetical protein